ncbi:MAG: M42 family peptidase, partial [Bergeyella zoohelcum]|nr:M42 family peptidase [Bergeyella zoohelcum]
VNSVQEEVGLYGADMIADTIKPNIAIVTDVTHDTTTPMINKNKEGYQKCGDGPVVFFAPSIHHNIRELIIDRAKKKKVPYQRAAASRVTGTDTDVFAHSNGGVPSALISLPLRYMHTTVEMVSKEDVKNTIQLIYETLLKISPEMNLKYH